MRGVCGINARSVFQFHAGTILNSIGRSRTQWRQPISNWAVARLRDLHCLARQRPSPFFAQANGAGSGFETTPMFEQTFLDPTGGSLPQQ
jgi:hypothetical protein